ncbi:carbonic anhydrase [Nitzschia inconspicua]|uniref:Carbonic anhydrase n=1 Tax=Nitzschia inconspicua TaxID=303405 RepID=A0A9K3LJ00_9STRA|nr:carbonic anhydrase [Nitzschia inconspicua]
MTLCSSALVAVLLLGNAANAQDWGDWYDSYKMDYTYDTTAGNGPANWGGVDGIGEWVDFDVTGRIAALGNQCDVGTRPSPILLDPGTGLNQQFYCQDLHEPLPRQINPDVDCSRWEVTFAITPYALKTYFPLSDGYCLRPSLILSGRMDPYVLLWMEIHTRSEHAIAGKRYDAEIQMIHAGTGREAGQLMTISLMVDASAVDDDLELEWMLQQWRETAQTEREYCNGGGDRKRRLRSPQQPDLSQYMRNGNFSSYKETTSRNQARNLQFTTSSCRTDRFGRGCEPLGPRRRMFPYNLWQSIWYYGYSGSLSAPPCSEIVQWRVLDEPLHISRRQYKELTFLLSQSLDDNCQRNTATDNNGENRRPIQESVNSAFQGVYYHCTLSNFGHFVYSPEDQ